MRLYPCDERDCYYHIGVNIFRKEAIYYISEMVLYHSPTLMGLMGLEVEETEVGDPSEL